MSKHTIDSDHPEDTAVVALPRPEVSSHAHSHTARPMAEVPPPAADHGTMGHGGHDMFDPRMAAAMEADMRRRFRISLVLAIPVVLYSPLATNLVGLYLPTPFGVPHDWVMLLFATPVALWTSSVFHVGAYQSLRSGTLNMSVLVSLGILASYLFSVGLTLLAPGQETFYEAAVMLAVFLLFGHWMEMRARRGSSDSVRKLLDLAPRQATVERGSRLVDVPVAEVVVGDTVVLKPGDRVPVDGTMLDGRGAVDESMVTGESLPVGKGPGDELIAGTINQAGSLRFRATRVGADTALAQIVKLVETAQNSKAPSQRLADRAAHYLVLVAVGSGLATFLVWFFVLREPLLLALTFAVTAVVIACPDALGLATPMAVMVATDLAAKRGVLFKQAVSLEQAAKIQAVIFDKTGTLTQGKPRVTDAIAMGELAEDEVLWLAGAVESRSGHPLAQAVLDELERRGVANDLSAGSGQALGVEPIMMTGDNQSTAEAVARQVGIDRVFAEVLPQDKSDGVKRLQAEGKFVAMVGDGVNDAPALAQADLGIAIGAGTDVAVETGDVVLMKSDPADVLAAIRLSKATVRKMRQNLFWAAIYNQVAIPVAAGVLYPAFGLILRPEFGALAMSASSITVVANALLLRREIAPTM